MYNQYNLGFKITELQNAIENEITVTIDTRELNIRVMNNPTNAIIYLDNIYPLSKEQVTYSLGKKIGFYLDNDNFVIFMELIE